MSSFDVIFREAARERGIQPRRHENEVSSTSLIPLSLIEFALENPMPKTERNHSEGPRDVASTIKRRLIYDAVECRKNAISDKIFDEIAMCFKDCDKIGYKDFSRRLQSLTNPEAATLLKSSVFQKFKVDNVNGCINVEDFLRYVQRAVDVESVYLNLLAHAGDSSFITEMELENFMFQYIPTVSVLMNMPEDFKPYYAYTAVRKFFFFLDTRRIQRIPINVLAESQIMEEFLYLIRLSQSDLEQTNPKQFDQELMTSWFSVESTMAIYNGFLDLDLDQSGMLNEAEMVRYQGCGLGNTIRRDIACQFTALAINRLFQENVTYEPSTELDYKRYVDFLLAVENRGSGPSSQYFFRLLDYDHIGKLTVFTIKYFYTDVRKTLLGMGVDCPLIDNVVREILDMMEATPEEIQNGITLQGLIASGHGHIILDMLLDVNSFWRYDNRESLMNHPPSGSSS